MRSTDFHVLPPVTAFPAPRILLAVAMGLILCLGLRSAAAQTVSVSPDPFDRGDSITVTYNSTGGVLAGVNPIRIHYGFNGFQGATNTLMTSLGGNLWSHTLSFPTNRTSIDFVFSNNAGSTFDNNGGSGVDYHLYVDLSGYPLGASEVPAAQGGGWVFRVWAPNAATANVPGAFNGWDNASAGYGRLVFDAGTGIHSGFAASATAGQEYKFHLSTNGWKKDPHARRLVNSTGNSIVYDPNDFDWQGDSFTMPAHSNLVVYEMHVGSAETLGGAAPGTFADLLAARTYLGLGTNFLDHLQSLNVNAVEILPPCEFPGDISGGYNLSDPWAIEEALGGPDGLKEFVRQCHLRGMGVIIDVVYNHFGPNDLDLYNFDSGTQGGIYFYDGTVSNTLAYTPFGPRPDYSSAEVGDYLMGNVEMWFDEYRADGLRFDFTKGIRQQVSLDGNFTLLGSIAQGEQFMRDVNDYVDATYPTALCVAEDLDNMNAFLTNATPGGLGFDNQWDEGFWNDILTELQKSTDSARDMSVIENVIAGSSTRLHWMDNHDKAWTINAGTRLASRLDSVTPGSYLSRKKDLLSAALLFTTPGVPMIFQGQEMHVAGSWTDSAGTDWAAANTAANLGILDAYEDLIRLRTNKDGASRGLTGATTTVTHRNDGAKVIAWRRQYAGALPGDDFMILANFSSTTFNSPGYDIGLPSSGTWEEHFNGDSQEFGADFSNVGVGQNVSTVANPLHGFAQTGTIAIGPYSAVILSKSVPTPTTVSAFLLD